jgi:hypothetical protein
VELGPRESVEPLGPRKSVELEFWVAKWLLVASLSWLEGHTESIRRQACFTGINQASGLFYLVTAAVLQLESERPYLSHNPHLAGGELSQFLSIYLDFSFFFMFVLNLSMVVLTKFSIQKYFSAQIISIYLDFSFFSCFFMFSIFILFLFCFCFFCIFCQILSFFGEFLSICECVFAFDLGHTYATSAISSWWVSVTMSWIPKSDFGSFRCQN